MSNSRLWWAVAGSASRPRPCRPNPYQRFGGAQQCARRSGRSVHSLPDAAAAEMLVSIHAVQA